MWHPISLAELETLVARDLKESNAEALTLFDKMRTEPQKAEFARGSSIDEIYIVGALGSKVIYYDDTEDGFEVGRLVGCRIEGGMGQFPLHQALCQILTGNR